MITLSTDNRRANHMMDFHLVFFKIDGVLMSFSEMSPSQQDEANAVYPVTFEARQAASRVVEPTLQINDKVTIAGKTYRVYNVMSESSLVCFGRINQAGKDLSAMNPHNIMTLTFAQVEKFVKLGTIVSL